MGIRHLIRRPDMRMRFVMDKDTIRNFEGTAEYLRHRVVKNPPKEHAYIATDCCWKNLLNTDFFSFEPVISGLRWHPIASNESTEILQCLPETIDPKEWFVLRTGGIRLVLPWDMEKYLANPRLIEAQRNMMSLLIIQCVIGESIGEHSAYSHIKWGCGKHHHRKDCFEAIANKRGNEDDICVALACHILVGMSKRPISTYDPDTFKNPCTPRILDDLDI
jgi:hypothetical protein